MNKSVDTLISEKINHIRNIITDTIIAVQLYKKHGIFSNSEVNICTSSMNDLYAKLTEIKKETTTDKKIEELQTVIDKLSTLLSTFGTKNLDDLLYMTFGSDFTETKTDEFADKFKLIRKYVHPVGFKIVSHVGVESASSPLCCNKITDETTKFESAMQFECFQCDPSCSSFYQKVYGIKVVLRCDKLKKTMVLNGLVDDIHVDLLENRYIKSRKKLIGKLKCDASVLARQLEMMTLKEILVYSDDDIGKRNAAIVSLSNRTRTDTLEKTINHFTSLDVYGQRNTLVDLLTRTDDGELKYTSYLLYDIISSDSNMDSNAQMMIYDSFPFQVKLYFKDAMKHTMNYTHLMTQKYDVSKLSLEQQVYAMRAPESVKEKAMIKLKEIKGKSDDSNGKAKQYLEGLLKIPFGTYREEPILKLTKEINAEFKKMVENPKEKYSIMEIYNTVDAMNGDIERISNGFTVPALTKQQTDSILQNTPSIIKKRTKKEQVAEIQRYINAASVGEKTRVMTEICPELNVSKNARLESVGTKLKEFEQSMLDIDKSFDVSVHGQKHAKNQLKKIICQWITGEQKGHCFGFEGSPGVGKTSLAKCGLSQCLKDENGAPRPFTFIALGGSCNGSTLEGHGYTYVNSIWGAIVQAFMDAKCMNPVFYFDEVDKISKEHGSEIVGILTHLIDYTQNDSFQDRFYTGVPLDTSKALFIFSYNDPELIDAVLLDRIHRIKFENLTLKEKVVIARDYVIPRITKNMGLENMVLISDESISEIIMSYTAEPGVRKMNEILFDLYGELNIELLHRSVVTREIPIVLTSEMIDKYLSKYHKVVGHKIHATPQVGVINGLYANSRGGGGIIQIEASLYPATSFMEMKLTGMQGDVMQESMHVAKTLAWSMCSKEIQDKLVLSKNVGLHIHCPEGATSKDGPSAGTAETVVIYSVLNEKPILNTIAITGEIDLRGNVTAIGGLANKIAGGIRAGVKTFLFPKENAKDYEEYKAKQTSVDNTITFIQVSHIDEVFQHVFVK